MTVNDLLTLLVILFFVVGPIINTLRRGSQTPPPRPQRPPVQPGAEGREAREPPAREPLPAEGPSSDFERRLEEARRRVQEAMEQGSGDRGMPERGMPRREGQTQARTQPERRPSAPAAPRREPVPATVPARPPEARRAPPAPQAPPSRQAALSREPRQSPYRQPQGAGDARATRPAAAGAYSRRSAESGLTLALDPRSLREAIMWREILDKPLSQRGPLSPRRRQDP